MDKLKELEDESVDLIITSPPFNLGNNHHTGNKRHKAYDDNMPEKDYQEWQIEVLNDCYRVLKQEGSMIYQHKNRIKNGIQISPYEWIFKTKFIIKQELVWFNGSQNFDKIRFYPMTERVYWLTKDVKTTLFNSINHHDFFDKSDWKPVGTKGNHTRAFPEKFVEDMLNVFPNANLILDPFAGAGTTGLVADRLGRDAILIELNPEYVKIIEDRIRNDAPMFVDIQTFQT